MYTELVFAGWRWSLPNRAPPSTWAQDGSRTLHECTASPHFLFLVFRKSSFSSGSFSINRWETLGRMELMWGWVRNSVLADLPHSTLAQQGGQVESRGWDGGRGGGTCTLGQGSVSISRRTVALTLTSLPKQDLWCSVKIGRPKVFSEF